MEQVQDNTQINRQNTRQTHWQMEKSQYIHTNKWTKYKTDTQINGANCKTDTQVNGQNTIHTHR